MRRANRRDDNHREVIDEFKRLNWQVLDTADLKNAFDILVSKGGITICIEIKDGSKSPSQIKLTKGEEEFRERWLGYYKIVKSIEQVQWLNAEWFFSNGLPR